MTDHEQLNHVLDAIDGALGEDWSVSGDAMRWAPPEEKPKRKPALTLPVDHRPPAAVAGSWLAGMRIVEDPAVPAGEVVVSVDHEFDEVYQDGAFLRRVISNRTVEARIPPVTAEQRAEQVERIAAAYDVPACVLEHYWGPEELVRGVDVGSGRDRMASVDTIRKVCTRCGRREIQTVGDYTYTVQRVAADESTPSFTCPSCSRTSYNPNDVREGYCGACHDQTRRCGSGCSWPGLCLAYGSPGCAMRAEEGPR